MLGQYQNALKKLTPAQRQVAVQTIFGQDAQRAANIIFGDGIDVYNRMVKAVSRQGGAAKQAAAQNKGFTGAMDAPKSSIETVQIQLGTVLLPVLTRYLRQAAKWLSDSENQKRLLDGVKDATELVVGAVDKLVTAFEALNTIAGSLKGTIKLLGAAYAGMRWRTLRGMAKVNAQAERAPPRLAVRAGTRRRRELPGADSAVQLAQTLPGLFCWSAIGGYSQGSVLEQGYGVGGRCLP